mmetsp:Transcript_24970/g.39209  ORF Transcript_24970/g.39209 Transcript_24970/m.39209 type:complete len:948 (-) Transcript_24970:402-3245(-)
MNMFWGFIVAVVLNGAIAVRGCSFFLSNFNASASVVPGQVLATANYYNRFRGPDATNVDYIQGWTFLHNLLSMTGQFTLQPFVSTSKDIAVLFNGEIYNYRELASRLAGHEDAYQSDGLALLPAYKRWGTSFVEYLQGEFAIVLVDFSKGVVLVSTDAFGTKPLWYASWPCGKVSASTICFAASSYESVLTGVGVPSGQRHMVDPNTVLVLSTQNIFKQSFSVISRKPFFRFNLTQYKNNTEDWQRAFLKAVQVRTERIKHKVFIGLSSGFDSGAIMLSLELLERPFFAYHVSTSQDPVEIVKKRIAYSKHANNSVITLDDDSYEKQKKWLLARIEKFHYLHDTTKTVTDDKASIGLSAILARVRKLGGLIYLSGSGADETISDYAINGKKIFSHSCFSGIFPRDLKKIFPWRSFYLGTQRSYLMKEELTGGAHGIESRYPFLDPHVVQEYLWLSADIKNSEYKRPVADYLRKYSFPNLYGAKAGFGVKKFKEATERHIESKGEVQHTAHFPPWSHQGTERGAPLSHKLRKNVSTPVKTATARATSVVNVDRFRLSNTTAQQYRSLCAGDKPCKPPQAFPHSLLFVVWLAALATAWLARKFIRVSSQALKVDLVRALSLFRCRCSLASNEVKENNARDIVFGYAVFGKASHDLRVLRTRGVLLVVAALYGTNYGSIKIMQRALRPADASFCRFSVAFAVLCPFLFSAPKAMIRPGLDIGCWVALGYAVQGVGLQTTDASTSAFFCSLAVIICPLLDAVSGKPVPATTWASVMLAVIGVAILELSSESAFSYGDAWSLLQPLGFGVGFWKIEKVMKKFPGKGKQLTALQLLVVWLTGAAWSCVESGGSPDMSHIVDRLTSWEVMGAVVWTGCVTTAMTVMLQTTSLGVLSSTETSVLYSTEPVWAALFARAVRISTPCLRSPAKTLSAPLTTQVFGWEYSSRNPTAFC